VRLRIAREGLFPTAVPQLDAIIQALREQNMGISVLGEREKWSEEPPLPLLPEIEAWLKQFKESSENN
jgi:hypothetical protein